MLVLWLVYVPALSASMKCWIGWQNWNEEPAVDNVHLAECPGKAECCAFVSSLNGRQFGCHETCPPKNYRQCGPDPRSGIQDLRYCYCRSHHDPRCTPYFESWDARSRLTTPMPPAMKRRIDLVAPVKPTAMRQPFRDVTIVGPHAPPSSQPLPPGIRPPAFAPNDAAARPPAARRAAAASTTRFGARPSVRLRRPAARRLMAPPGRRTIEKINKHI